MDAQEKDRINNPSLEREQLAPVAREPHGDATAEGWGSFDRFPNVDLEDEPALGDTRVKPDAHAPGGVETVRPRLNDTQGWPSDQARDFRVEEDEPETVRPVTE